MTTTDPLRDYMCAVAHDGHFRTLDAFHALAPNDQALVQDFLGRMDEHATENAGLLADLTDAIYGKGTAETKGYPRGMVAKARRVFNLLRQCKRQGYLSLTHEHRLISEVK